MGEVVQFRDYQSPSARERAQKALEEHLAREATTIAKTVMGLVEIPPFYDPRKPT